MNVARYTANEMAAVDRAMVEACGLDILQVMETAGRMVAVAIREWFGGRVSGKRIDVLAGSGGNGGDGLVAARYLLGWGARPFVWLGMEIPAASIAGHQLSIVRNLGIPVWKAHATPDFGSSDLIVDGLFGFGLSGPPRGQAAILIEGANASGVPIVAIDVPSGLDSTSGRVNQPCIEATLTVTLAAPKTGLLHPDASEITGELVLADIGVPDLAYRAAGFEPPGITWDRSLLRLTI